MTVAATAPNTGVDVGQTAVDITGIDSAIYLKTNLKSIIIDFNRGGVQMNIKKFGGLFLVMLIFWGCVERVASIPVKEEINLSCSTLRCAAEQRGILVGTDLYPPQEYYIDSNSGTKTQMGQITADNFNAGWVDMNWKKIEPSPNKFDFTSSDAQVKWAEDHGIQPWSHALIANLGQDPTLEFLPDWLMQEKNPAIVREHFKRRITTLMKRYQGRIARVPTRGVRVPARPAP